MNKFQKALENFGKHRLHINERKMIKRNGMEFKNAHEYNTWLLDELLLIANNTENIYNLIQSGLYRQAYLMAKGEIETWSGYKVYGTNKVYDAFIKEVRNNE